MGYLTHFLVYLLAMLSVIGLALFVYKKFSIGNFAPKNNNSLRVEDILNLSPRKTLYVINANGEKFLIAGDMERTTLISKLGGYSPAPVRREVHNKVDLTEFIKKEDSLYSREQAPVMKKLVKKLGGDID